MKTSSSVTKSEKPPTSDEFLRFKIQKSQARFERIRNPSGSDTGHGEFFLLLDITAVKETLYIPISIASGKKSTGFVYQIEGTAVGSISTTDISCRGGGITKITFGTLLYAKIPKGTTASFRILVEMRGKVGKEYTIVINRIHYKLDPRDARYKRFNTEISSKRVRFG